MNIVERLQKILIYSNLSVRALANRCALKQQTLDKHIKGMSEPSVSTLVAIATAFPEISPEWILLGNGSMLKADLESERINKLIDTITTLQETINAKNIVIDSLTKHVEQLETQLKK